MHQKCVSTNLRLAFLHHTFLCQHFFVSALLCRTFLCLTFLHMRNSSYHLSLSLQKFVSAVIHIRNIHHKSLPAFLNPQIFVCKSSSANIGHFFICKSLTTFLHPQIFVRIPMDQDCFLLEADIAYHIALCQNCIFILKYISRDSNSGHF